MHAAASKMLKVVAVLGVLIALGVGIAYFLNYHGVINSGSGSKAYGGDSISRRLIENVDPAKIVDNLRMLTKEMHVAGTEANYKVADDIAALWKRNGLEDVHMIKYNVLLSYPNYSNPNHISVLNPNGEVVFQTLGVSPAIIPEEQKDPRAGVQWVAYSGNGSVEGDAVYCHYGLPADFDYLEKNGVSVKGKIAIMRYNSDFRGDKVHNAALRGAIGAVIYSDPAECAKDGIEVGHVYPQTIWMPSKGVQRGSVLHGNGDPLTPNLPSREDLFPERTILEAMDAEVLPRIPVLPMSYSDAKEVLGRLGGEKAPNDWQGGLGFTYNLGPGFEKTGEEEAPKLRIEVNSRLEIREIRDVIGYIHGESEPDDYLLLSNHYDAWVYGSIDPNSGTAVLAEVARTFTQTMNETGWRPARSLMFCNWDAEEFMLIGSVEFAEEFANVLKERAVAVLNVDLISDNQTLVVRTVPTMYQAAVEAAKKVPNPKKEELEKGRQTVYDTWLQYYPANINWLPGYPKMPVPGGGSDHLPFINTLGIPVADFRFRNSSWRSYPLYHTMYETPFLNEHLFDHDNFSIHKANGQFWAELARSFVDSPILPLNVSILARMISDEYLPELEQALGRMGNGELGNAKGQLVKAKAKAIEFLKAANDFESGYPAALSKGPGMVARMNRRLKAVDRCFIDPRGGISGKAPSPNKNVMFSLSDFDTYAAVVMPGVYDAISRFNKTESSDDKEKAGRYLASQISVVQFAIQCAIGTLQMFI